MDGKKICRILKEIRQRIANENDIALEVSECNHKGDCPGSCPKCEAEVRFLESELGKRTALGKSVTLAGIAFTMASCTPFGGQVQGIVPGSSAPDPNSEIILLEGDVPYIPEKENENSEGESLPKKDEEEEQTETE